MALRWVVEQGVSVIVKSFSKERMKENPQVFDWQLGVEDVSKIHSVPQARGCKGTLGWRDINSDIII